MTQVGPPNFSLELIDIIKKIQEQYPQAMALLGQPGVMQVYADAINNGWSGDRIIAAMQNTEWWKNTPDPQRKWMALSATDPATAHTALDTTQHQVDDLMGQLGVNLDRSGGLSSPYAQFLNLATVSGWDQNQIRYQMLLRTQYKGYDPNGGGELATDAAHVKGMADDYGVSLSDKSVLDWSRQMAQGAVDDKALTGYILEQAKSRFPGLTDALDRGVTVRQYADQYLQVLQQETGANTATMSMADPKILTALDQVAIDGTHYSMSIADWTKKVRSDPTYGYDTTDQAHAKAASLATQVAQKMGAIS